jgi:glycosyltransferase involved in cell wall biosynthesis
VQRARGDVICLLPADDWLEPGALARVTQEFQSDPELDVLSCGTRIVHFEPDGSMRVDASFVSPELLEFSLPKILRHPLTAGRFMRRRVYKRFGGHGADYRFGDFDFLVRVCLGGAKAKTLPVLTYTYVRHAKSSTLSGNAENLSAMADDSIKVAEEHLVRTDLNSIDRKALVALHGRASARLASALCRDGRLRRAAEIVLRAMRVNPAWPLCIPVWMVKGALERARLSRIARSESAEGP